MQATEQKTGLLLPALVNDLTPVQKGWLQLCQIRLDTFAKLEIYELEVQQKINDSGTDNLVKVQAGLKLAKQVFDQLKDCRMQLTNLLKTKIVERSMMFEKRCEKLIADLEATGLELRKRAELQQQKEQALSKEIAAFKNHYTGQKLKIEAEFEARLRGMVYDAYKMCLQTATPVDAIQAQIDGVGELLKKETPLAAEKFAINLMERDKAKEIYNEVFSINKEGIINATLIFLVTTFAGYEHDLYNAAKAIEQNEVARATDVAAVQKQTEIAIATDTLIASAETYIVTGGAKVKRKKEIIVENTSEWCIKVMSEFLKNSSRLGKHIKVKEYANLTVGQMAAALSRLHNEIGITYEGLRMQEIEK